jgi:hypothetical protein
MPPHHGADGDEVVPAAAVFVARSFGAIASGVGGAMNDRTSSTRGSDRRVASAGFTRPRLQLFDAGGRAPRPLCSADLLNPRAAPTTGLLA